MRKPLFWLLAIVVVPLAVGTAFAQPNDIAERRNRSHLLLPSEDSQPDDPESLFAQRLGDLRTQREMRKLAEAILHDPGKYGLSTDDLERLKQEAVRANGKPPDMNSPEMQKIIAKLLARQQQGALVDDPALDPKQLEKLIPKTGSNGAPTVQPMPAPAPGPNEPMSSGNALQQPEQPDEGEVLSPKKPTRPNAAATEGDGSNPAASEARVKFIEQLTKAAGRVQGLDTAFRNSPALNQAIQDLNRDHGTMDDRWLEWAGQLGDWGDWVPRMNLSQTVQKDSDLASRVASSLSKLSPSGGALDKLDKLTGPRVPSVEAPEDGWLPVFVGLGFLVLAGAMVWAVRLRYARQAALGQAAGWRLGNWPVHPAAVRTRQEMVQAFEYLSLLCLGPTAQHQNHLDLADRLGADELPAGANPWLPLEERRHAADHLAALYEQARYAPPDDPWPEAELGAARRDLCSLAGVHTA